jgi:hypothetical protein
MSSTDETGIVMRMRACIAGIDTGTVSMSAVRSVLVEAVLHIRDLEDPVFTTNKRARR